MRFTEDLSRAGMAGARFTEFAELKPRRPVLLASLVPTDFQTFYPRHGYTEAARGRQDGYDRVFYAKQISARRCT
jgi:hypothetical protein